MINMAIQLTPLHHNHNSMMHVFDSESSFRRNFHPPPGAGHPRMDEMAYKLPHPPSNLPLEGGGSYLPSLSGGGQGWGWGNWWSHLDNPIAQWSMVNDQYPMHSNKSKPFLLIGN
jgi:hypothetical protein